MPGTRTAPRSPSTPAATVLAASCTACSEHPGERLSRHAVSTGWISYHRCAACAAVRVVQTPRITWFG